MRLKGGKVLIDLTKYDISQDISYPCSDEEIKAILEKGVSVKIFSGISCVIDLIPQVVRASRIGYNTLTLYYDDTEHQYGVDIDLTLKRLRFVEN